MTPKQTALVHVAAKQLCLDEETYRAVLFHHGGGVTSAKDLHADGFRAVTAYFTACGFRSTWTKRTFGVGRAWRRPARSS